MISVTNWNLNALCEENQLYALLNTVYHCALSNVMVNALKIHTMFLIKWRMQTLQTQIRLLLRSSLIRVYTVCHSTMQSFTNQNSSCLPGEVKFSWKTLKFINILLGMLVNFYLLSKKIKLVRGSQTMHFRP